MGLFYFLSVLLLFGAFIKPKWQWPYMYLCFIFLFILSAFRATSVGTDTIGYEALFLRLKNGTSIRQEQGWQFLNELVIFFGGSFEHLLIASTLLVLLPVFYVVRRYSLNPMLSLFLYYAFYIYLQSFNITRQTIAVSIVFLAFTFLLKKKYWQYCLIVILASTFHITALLCLPLVFVNRIPDRNWIYLALIFGSMVVSMFLSNIILQKSASLLGYEGYLDRFESGTQTGLYFLILNAFSVFILFTAKNRGTLFKLFFIYIAVANLTARIPFGYRVIYYFTILQILYLPYFICNNKIKAKPLIFALVVLYAYLVFSRSSGSSGIIPYINTLF